MDSADGFGFNDGQAAGPGPAENSEGGFDYGGGNFGSLGTSSDGAFNPAFDSQLASFDMGYDPATMSIDTTPAMTAEMAFDDSFLGKLYSFANSALGKGLLGIASVTNPALGLALGIGKLGLAGAAGKGAQSMGAGLGGALGSFAAGPVGGFLGSMAGSNAFGGFQGTGTAADAGFSSNGLGDGLLGLYGGYRSLQEANGVRSSLADMYGQNSPYAQALRQQLARRDAAAGRRSQYGGREVELQAKLAQLMSQNAPAMLQANSQSAIARNLMLRNGLMAYRSLGSLFPGDSGAGSVPGGYDVGGQTYNNPSAYTAPSTESFWDNAAWPGFEGI